MTTTTAFIEAQNTPGVISGIATIDAGENTTLAIPAHGRSVITLEFPSTFTGTTVTFLVQAFPSMNLRDGTNITVPFDALKDSAGNTVTYTIGTTRTVRVPELSGAYAFEIVSGSTEGSARQILVSCTGLNPTVTKTNVTATVNPVTSTTTNGYGTTTNVTRPANTTPYTAGDVVGGAIDLGVMGPSASPIIIDSARLMPQISAIPSGMTSFTLYLYGVTPPSAIADNSPFALTSGDYASFKGSISMGSPALPSATSTALIVETNNLGKQVALSGTHLFAYLVTTSGFTPAANSEVYAVTLHSVAV